MVEYGASVKYALVNNREEGFSLAALGGAGLGFEGYYFFAGPIFSYKLDWFEPYFISRFNYVKFPSPKISIATIGEFSVAPGIYRYLQHTLGFMVWPKDWVGVGLEASLFGTIRSPFILREKNKMIVSWNFSFRF